MAFGLKHQHAFSAGGLPLTPPGELTAISKSPRWIWGPFRGREEARRGDEKEEREERVRAWKGLASREEK